MIEIIRYLKGYLKVRVSGYAPERFMNLCTGRSIILWGVTGGDGYYEMYIGLSDFFLIKDIVRKTKTKVVVLTRYGLPFFVQNFIHRKVFVGGVVFCLAFLIIASKFIWAMEFSGNEMISDKELRKFFSANEISYGMPKKELQLAELESAVREEFPIITWVSAELKGCKLILEIKENDLPTKEEVEEELNSWENGADLCASASGIVYSILTRSGIPMVKAGDTVEKGQILIGGLIPVTNDDGTVRRLETTAADGDVLIETVQPIEIEQKLKYTYKNYTGRTKKYRFISFLENRIIFPFLKHKFIKYDEVTNESRLQLFGQIDLPISIGNIEYREYLPVEAVYDEESAKELLGNRFLKIIEGLEQKGVHIIQKDVKIVKKADSVAISGTLTVHIESAFRKAVSVPETESQSTVQSGE